MNYARQQRDPRRHLVGIGSVILIHVVVVYALVNGLARKVVEAIKKPLEVAIIEEIKLSPPPKAAPSPPKTVAPPTFVPPPEVAVAAPAAPAVVAVSSQPVATAGDAPRPATVNVGVACPNHQEVRSRIPFPPQAARMGLSGEVLIEFTVMPGGEVADITVLKSSHRLFSNAASAAVAQFRCVGQGHAVKVHVPFAFRLEG